MKRLIGILFSLFLTPVAAMAAATAPFGIAEQAVPVYNDPLAAASKLPLKPDACGQVRALEFVALPGTAFKILRQTGDERQPVLEVTTNDYTPPPGTRLYLALAAIKPLASQPAERIRPSSLKKDTVLKRLRSAMGTPYIWGANQRDGVILNGMSGGYAGLDCSGLLYEATEGLTPRNTAELVTYGQAVPIAGLSRDQIIARLKPLDLIVWKGHVVIVADREQTIESVLWCKRPGNGGVVTAPLRNRLGEIMTRRKGVNSWPEGGGKPQLFVVRRWLE